MGISKKHITFEQKDWIWATSVGSARRAIVKITVAFTVLSIISRFYALFSTFVCPLGNGNIFFKQVCLFFMQMSGSYDKMLLLHSTMIILSDNPYT